MIHRIFTDVNGRFIHIKWRRLGTNELHDTVWKLSHYTVTGTGAGTYCAPLVLVPVKVPVRQTLNGTRTNIMPNSSH